MKKPTYKRYSAILRATLMAFAFSACLPLLSYAQEEPESISVKLRIYFWNQPSDESLLRRPLPVSGAENSDRDYAPPALGFVDSQGTFQSLSATAKRLSGIQQYKGPNPITFAMQRSVNGAALPSPINVGEIRLPADATEVILFFFPDHSSQEVRYNVVAIPSSKEALPIGEALVINLTNTTLATKIGENQTVLSPNSSNRFAVRGKEGDAMPILLGAQNAEEQWERKLHQSYIIPENPSPIIVFYKSNERYRMETININ